MSLPLTDDDHDREGALTEAGVERLFTEVRAAYFERCRTVSAHDLEARDVQCEPGLAVVGEVEVTIGVSVVEVFPDSFRMQALLRTGESSSTAWATLVPSGGEVTNEMRDEFIALAHAARHYL